MESEIMDKIENIEHLSNDIEGMPKDFDHQEIWKFTIDNNRICIEILANIKNKKIKVFYNQEIVYEIISLEDNNRIQFSKEGYNYKISFRNNIPELYIEDESLEDLYKKQNNTKSKLVNKNDDFNYGIIDEDIYGDINEDKNFMKKQIPLNEDLYEDECEIGSLYEGSYISKKIKDEFLINIKFFNIENVIQYPKKNLNGLLNLFFIKYISDFFENEDLIKLSPEIKDIIIKLRNNINFSENKKENIQLLLKESKGNNILVYSQYLNLIINEEKKTNLISLLCKEKKEKINIYWGILSNYVEYSSFFEKEFRKHLKNSIFDYSLISLGIVERKDENEYNENRNNCPNMTKKIVYHGTQIGPISSILTDEFKYSRRPFYGMGIYFTDIIDYISFYCGGTTFNYRRENFYKIIPVNSTFSFISTEIFYDQNKFRQIEDDHLYVDDLPSFPSYECLKRIFPDKMVKPNGIHFIRVDVNGDELTEKKYKEEKKEGKFVANEYAITEKYQIFPIYSLTVKRNEYFILWRDPNFSGKNKWSNYLLERKLFCTEKANLNIYFENSTEEALDFIVKRKYNKIIIITSIGLDLSGKKFIEVARKILGFDVMVLFFSANEKHLKWITKFPNCLYTHISDFYEDYILNFNEKGLKKLKKEIEKEYHISLMDFSKDFLSYPKFVNQGRFDALDLKTKNPYFRHVRIYCKNKNSLFFLSKEGKVGNGSDADAYKWDVTIVDNEITLFCNGFYLDVCKDNENITGCQFMKRWKFGKKGEYYYFRYPGKKNNNILSFDGIKAKVKSEKPGDKELFKLVDVFEEE